MIRFLVSCIVIFVLIGCGGGGSSSQASDDSDISIWSSGCDAKANESFSLVVFQKNPNLFGINVFYFKYNQPNCTGGSTSPPTITLEMQILENVMVSGQLVTKVIISGPGLEPTKDLVYIGDSYIQFGNTNDGAPLDLQGFPTELDPSEIYYTAGSIYL